MDWLILDEPLTTGALTGGGGGATEGLTGGGGGALAGLVTFKVLIETWEPK